MRAVLIDDEYLALNYLEYKLQQIGDVDIAGKFVDPLAGKEWIDREHVDVVFLDIDMPGINGIELSEQLLENKPDLMIVFITAYDEYAVQAFEQNSLDYVMKPVGTKRLMKTMQRIQKNLGEISARLPERLQNIQIKMFQQFIMKQEDKTIVPIRWRTAKAQELFLYLLQCRGQLVRKSALADMLWPEFEPSKAYSQLYTAVYHIRKTLEPLGTSIKLSNATDGYILYLENVQLDLEEWESFIRMGQPISDKTIDDYEKIMALYTHDYLQEFDYWWAESERYRLKQIWFRMTVQMAEWYVSCGRPERAMEKYKEACERCPQSEEAHFALMKMYAAENNHLQVHRQYQLLCDALIKEWNEQPSPPITEWYSHWNQT